MKTVLLCSPDFIRLNSNISDNVNSKVLATGIREVQDNELQEILGQSLMKFLQDLVSTQQIDEPDYKTYKEVLDKAQLFIAYKVIAEIMLMLNFKIDNSGLMQTRDENLDYVDLNDTLTLKNHYNLKADHYAFLLQQFLLAHRNEIPELDGCQCRKLKSVLYSAANPSIFLGGARGRGFACWRRTQPRI